MQKQTSDAEVNKLLPSELFFTDEQEKKVENILTSTKKDNIPNFWNQETCKTFYVPVDDGELKILHIKPKNPQTKRPLVFVPGWGGLVEGYTDFYEVIHNKLEFYYIETREKRSSRLNRRKAKMNMTQKAKDIQDIIKYLGIDKQDFTLFGTCWGGAIILHGLIKGLIKAPTIIANDPMHTLWFPKWLLKYIAPLMPVPIVKFLKPIFKRAQLRGMEEKVQRKRAEDFVDKAEVWKWKKAAVAVKDFELIGQMSSIQEEVFITNGTADKVHDQYTYPVMAKELSNGRFIYLKTDESMREYLMGYLALEFCKVGSDDGIPPSLQEFEKNLIRER